MASQQFGDDDYDMMNNNFWKIAPKVLIGLLACYLIVIWTEFLLLKNSQTPLGEHKTNNNQEVISNLPRIVLAKGEFFGSTDKPITFAVKDVVKIYDTEGNEYYTFTDYENNSRITVKGTVSFRNLDEKTIIVEGKNELQQH
jgi:hypothetical protein